MKSIILPLIISAILSLIVSTRLKGNEEVFNFNCPTVDEQKRCKITTRTHDDKTSISISTLIDKIKKEDKDNKYFIDINELVFYLESIKSNFIRKMSKLFPTLKTHHFKFKGYEKRLVNRFKLKDFLSMFKNQNQTKEKTYLTLELIPFDISSIDFINTNSNIKWKSILEKCPALKEIFEHFYQHPSFSILILTFLAPPPL